MGLMDDMDNGGHEMKLNLFPLLVALLLLVDLLLTAPPMLVVRLLRLSPCDCRCRYFVVVMRCVA